MLTVLIGKFLSGFELKNLRNAHLCEALQFQKNLYRRKF